ncbi:MAG: hypothetical protein R2705_19330 [Ilumatobacteraceae bacterium]
MLGGPRADHDGGPELPGVRELTRALRDRGVIVSAGHTDADATVAHRAFDDGITMVTHLWNAQRQPSSRAPELAGVALSRPDVFTGLIADGVHVAPEMVLLSLAAAGGRCFR